MSHAAVFTAFAHCFRTLALVVVDLVRLARLAAHSHGALAAENLFLRKQLALFQSGRSDHDGPTMPADGRWPPSAECSRGVIRW
jgi:hypothetical protein